MYMRKLLSICIFVTMAACTAELEPTSIAIEEIEESSIVVDSSMVLEGESLVRDGAVDSDFGTESYCGHYLYISTCWEHYDRGVNCADGQRKYDIYSCEQWNFTSGAYHNNCSSTPSRRCGKFGECKQECSWGDF
jgi:hypothetical protein